LLSARIVIRISGHSGGFVLARRGGTLLKKASPLALKWQSGIQFAKEKLLENVFYI